MVTPKKLRIGDVLLEPGLISEAQLNEALQVQKEQGGKLGDLFIQLGFVTETEFLRALSNQLHMPFIELEHYNVQPELVRKLPERVARRFKVIVLDKISEQYLIAMADPTDVLAYDEVSHLLSAPIRVAIVRQGWLLKIIDQVYRRTEDIASFAEELKEEMLLDEEFDQEDGVTVDAAPVAKLLDSIFEDAVQVGASDIHIEPDETVLRIRQRVDGILHEEIFEERKIVNALVLRIKLLAKLNISERRLPQDGRFQVVVKGQRLDVRVSTMPIRFGESVVMRLLDQSKGLLKLDQINLRDETSKRILYHIHRPNGLVLVTGPTGSGKTTTLYAILNELNERTKKIITIEDPIEYTLSRINQVQVNAAIDLSFARVLRTALRQDPEVVMVGEMRDEETAKIGLRAALTGHLVLSTLHTNDAISSAMRLIDMGVQGYLVAAATRLIIAQRLIRKLCDTCKKPRDLNPTEKHLVSLLGKKIDPEWRFCFAVGCPRCNSTGYVGRVGIHEILEMNPVLANALRHEDSNEFVTLSYQQKNFKPLVIAAFEYAIEGQTSLEEVFRISSEVEDPRKSQPDQAEP